MPPHPEDNTGMQSFMTWLGIECLSVCVCSCMRVRVKFDCVCLRFGRMLLDHGLDLYAVGVDGNGYTWKAGGASGPNLTSQVVEGAVLSHGMCTCVSGWKRQHDPDSKAFADSLLQSTDNVPLPSRPSGKGVDRDQVSSLVVLV